MFRILIIALWALIISLALKSPGMGFSSSAKTLHIFAWGDIFQPEALAAFEKEKGVKIKLSTYSTNEELIRKLKASPNAYDLVVPSCYGVSLLKEQNLIKPLELDKLTFLDKIDPKLFESKEYAIPFQWEVYGFGIDKEYFKTHPFTPTFEQLFGENVSAKIAMVNDPIEAIEFAAFYLFGPVETLTSKQLHAVEKLLRKQRKWIEAYVYFRTEYFLATKSSPLAVNSSSYIHRFINDFDFVDFVIPEDYSFISVEHLALPSNGKKDDLLYDFINFFFEDERLAGQCEYQYMYPSSSVALGKMHLTGSRLKTLESIQNKPLHKVKPLVSNEQSQKLWVKLKSTN